MTRAAVERHRSTSAPLEWREAAVREVLAASARARTLVLEVPGWGGHRAGQHVEVRLTAEHQHLGTRCYSIASAPRRHVLELTVEPVDEGGFSPYFAEALRPGDRFELRGPIGDHFTWSVADGGPLLLVAGGSGLVPLMSMLRHRATEASVVPTRALISVRGPEDRLYGPELCALEPRENLRIDLTYTRSAPPGWRGWRRRIDADMLSCLAWEPVSEPRTYICGPRAFVERITDLLLTLGHDPRSIRTERFGSRGSCG